MATSLKEVKITARYAHKTNGKFNGLVTYAVRSSDGSTIYCTTLVDGKASGCSCPAKSSCYHKKQLEIKESARPFAAKVLPVWTEALVKTGKLVAPAKAVKVVELPVGSSEKKEVHTPTDLSNKGHLNVSRGFSLLKVS